MLLIKIAESEGLRVMQECTTKERSVRIKSTKRGGGGELVQRKSFNDKKRSNDKNDFGVKADSKITLT